MAWNEPGGSGNRDPWGRRADAGPPDLDELFRRLRRRLGGGDSRNGNPAGPPPALWGGLLALLVALWLGSGFYVVREGERGVVLRFGKFASTTTPGLRWHLPAPIERVLRVNIGEIRTAEIGYRSQARSRADTDVTQESQMLTADENIVDVKLAVQYRVKDAADYVFKVREPDLTVAQVAESAIREVVGKSRMEFILTEGRDAVAQQVAELLQTTLDRYGTGIEVTSVNMQDAQPPEPVQAAFFDAVKAREDEQRLINEAQAYRNEVIPRARGEVARILADAEAYRGEAVARAEGDGARFAQLAQQYRAAPQVTRQRLYLETMEQVLARTPKVLVGDGRQVALLPLDKLLAPAGAEQASAAATEPPPPSASAPPRSARERSDYPRGREPRP
ncbi:FtsH protease activity modulator HflK [Immundisolibacter sp.]|uniref:FtsH protease activity modulator HflK n=1 Tax=Immundisolibacter sp. TaxID=1934948 RepID=UPI002617B2FA|nr:FtsH protease activity modulator HflK [Immundisolibacter sp.]MDD3650310.1 FtsH protease activity modulator HflK [Immundisolibacter sp.]